MLLYLKNAKGKQAKIVYLRTSRQRRNEDFRREAVKNMSQIHLIVLAMFLFVGSISSCFQAWNGGGTGAWYRVDTSCEYPLVSTNLTSCLPNVSLTANETSSSDGFYVSLGMYNRWNGVSIDVGLTFDWTRRSWTSYANDDRGWKSGSISLDPLTRPCVDVFLTIADGSIKYQVREENQSTLLGQDVYLSSQIDPMLNLTRNSSNFGFYRFDSIAQIKETLKTGSQMISSRTNKWLFELQSGEILLADATSIASNVRGYPPGPCCTDGERKTITVLQEIKWNQSNVSISYL